MLTLQDYFINMLMQRGLDAQYAKLVMEAAKGDPKMESMKLRWFDEFDGYQPELRHTLWITVKETAAKWLKENLPKHWALPAFEEKAQIQKK